MSDEAINRLIAGISSAGKEDDSDRELKRYKQFANCGLTDLLLRLFGDPMDELKLIGERVLPVFRQRILPD